MRSRRCSRSRLYRDVPLYYSTAIGNCHALILYFDVEEARALQVINALRNNMSCVSIVMLLDIPRALVPCTIVRGLYTARRLNIPRFPAPLAVILHLGGIGLAWRAGDEVMSLSPRIEGARRAAEGGEGGQR